MTTLKPPGTMKDALHKAVGILSLKKVAVITDHSDAYIYELMNPNSKKNISAEDALALDLACLGDAGETPFFTAYRLVIDAVDGRDRAEIGELLLNAQAALGVLTKAVLEARGPLSDGGRKVTQQERKRIYDFALQLISKAEEIIHAAGDGARPPADKKEAA